MRLDEERTKGGETCLDRGVAKPPRPRPEERSQGLRRRQWSAARRARFANARRASTARRRCALARRGTVAPRGAPLPSLFAHRVADVPLDDAMRDLPGIARRVQSACDAKNKAMPAPFKQQGGRSVGCDVNPSALTRSVGSPHAAAPKHIRTPCHLAVGRRGVFDRSTRAAHSRVPRTAQSACANSKGEEKRDGEPDSDNPCGQPAAPEQA